MGRSVLTCAVEFPILIIMLSDHLKDQCRLDHDSIENSLDLLKLVSHPDHYLRLLKSFYSYYLPVEQCLHSFEKDFSKLGIELNRRAKLDLLKADLKYLGLTEAEIGDIELCQSIPNINDIYQAMGTLYVLEGSTLGAQIIFKRLTTSNIIAHHGLGGSFFKPYEDQTFNMWQQFKHALNLLSGDQDLRVLTAAKETFKTMEHCLSQNSAGKVN